MSIAFFCTLGPEWDQMSFSPAMGPMGQLKVPQIGRVIIQDDVENVANSTIDRRALKDTIIGEGTKIDNLVQIGHNASVGRPCVHVGLVGISGSVVLDDLVDMGGEPGNAGHIRNGDGAQLARASHATHDVPTGVRMGARLPCRSRIMPEASSPSRN